MIKLKTPMYGTIKPIGPVLRRVYRLYDLPTQNSFNRITDRPRVPNRRPKLMAMNFEIYRYGRNNQTTYSSRPWNPKGRPLPIQFRRWCHPDFYPQARYKQCL